MKFFLLPRKLIITGNPRCFVSKSEALEMTKQSNGLDCLAALKFTMNRTLLWVMVRFAMTAIIFYSLSVQLFAANDPVNIQTKLDKNKAYIGERIRYSVIIKTKKDIDVKFPDFGKEMVFQEEPKSEVSGSSNTEKKRQEPEINRIYVSDNPERIENSKSSKKIIKEYVLTGYDPGEYFIAKQEIKYKQKDSQKWDIVFTDEVKLRIRSIMKESKNSPKDIRGIKGTLSEHRVLKIVLIILSVLIFFAGAAIVYFRFFKKTGKTEQKIIIPAHITAYEELEALRSKKLVSKGMIKQFYFELSSIARRYLEKRFSLRAPEMTTEEFLISLKDSKVLSYEQKGLLKEFLSHCDMVKFAKYGPTDKEIDSSFNSAKKLIDETKDII